MYPTLRRILSLRRRAQWKRLIQKSEREFEEAHGHPPYLSDKQVSSFICFTYVTLLCLAAAPGTVKISPPVTAEQEQL